MTVSEEEEVWRYHHQDMTSEFHNEIDTPSSVMETRGMTKIHAKISHKLIVPLLKSLYAMRAEANMQGLRIPGLTRPVVSFIPWQKRVLLQACPQRFHVLWIDGHRGVFSAVIHLFPSFFHRRRGSPAIL